MLGVFDFDAGEIPVSELYFKQRDIPYSTEVYLIFNENYSTCMEDLLEALKYGKQEKGEEMNNLFGDEDQPTEKTQDSAKNDNNNDLTGQTLTQITIDISNYHRCNTATGPPLDSFVDFCPNLQYVSLNLSKNSYAFSLTPLSKKLATLKNLKSFFLNVDYVFLNNPLIEFAHEISKVQSLQEINLSLQYTREVKDLDGFFESFSSHQKLNTLEIILQKHKITPQKLPSVQRNYRKILRLVKKPFLFEEEEDDFEFGLFG